MRNSRLTGLIVIGSTIFLGAALVTLRAAEQATAAERHQAVPPTAVLSNTAPPGATQSNTVPAAHPPPSAPEQSATIVDDPTIAPDAAQSADNNVSFPTDI